MQKKEVEKLLGLKKSYIDYLIRKEWVLPKKKDQFFDFSEEDVEKIKLLRVLKSLHVSEEDVGRWNEQEISFDDILAGTEMKLNDEVKKFLGALEMIQEMRTCCTTSQTIPVDYYWEKIRFSKDKDSKEFMGKFELEDISDWAELHVNTERIAKCPYCGKENSIDVEEYIYDETMEEKSCGTEKYSYFEVDDCRCHSCGKGFVAKGYICEYPVGVYDSHEIKTIKNEEVEYMARLTKLNRQKILGQNEGFTANTSYDSRNSSYDRQYTVKGGKLHIQESGKTSWADSRYNKEWVATDEETHRFLYDNQWRMNTDGID